MTIRISKWLTFLLVFVCFAKNIKAESPEFQWADRFWAELRNLKLGKSLLKQNRI